MFHFTSGRTGTFARIPVPFKCVPRCVGFVLVLCLVYLASDCVSVCSAWSVVLSYGDPANPDKYRYSKGPFVEVFDFGVVPPPDYREVSRHEGGFPPDSAQKFSRVSGVWRGDVEATVIREMDVKVQRPRW